MRYASPFFTFFYRTFTTPERVGNKQKIVVRDLLTFVVPSLGESENESVEDTITADELINTEFGNPEEMPNRVQERELETALRISVANEGKIRKLTFLHPDVESVFVPE